MANATSNSQSSFHLPLGDLIMAAFFKPPSQTPLHPAIQLNSEFPFSSHLSVSSQVKRGMDVLGALLGLALALPVGIIIAVAIQLDDPGPVFYRQTRCGLHGALFEMWKFRSMVVNADGLKNSIANQATGCIFKNDCDPRVTRVGRILRKTSLDELPQLWNVLRGEMSLVGTRPPTPDEANQYSPLHWQRLQVKPGITGEWQTNGRSLVSDFEDIVKLDLAYQDKWSVRYDLQLLWKTVWVVVRSNGAY